MKIARYGRKGKVRELLADAGIVRNRLKIAATIGDAQAYLAVKKEFGSFDRYIWRFLSGSCRKNYLPRVFAGDCDEDARV